MKEYIKPKIELKEYSIEDILMVSTSDDSFDFENVGGFDEIW